MWFVLDIIPFLGAWRIDRSLQALSDLAVALLNQGKAKEVISTVPYF